MPSRINFSPAVRSTIAARVNYQCSVPHCKHPAVGPFKSDSSVAINMGTACHIYSAVPDGPRGQAERSTEWLGSVDNGIWCCAYHGIFIDKRQGADFPPDTLLMWKALAEARVLRQLSGVNSPLGWIDTLEILHCRFFHLPPRLALSAKTLVSSPHAAGQSLLFESVAGLSDENLAERPLDASSGKQGFAIEARIVFSTAASLDNTIELSYREGQLVRKRDGYRLFIPPPDLEIVLFSSRNIYRIDEEDDFQLLKRLLKVDDSSLRAIVGTLNGESLIAGKYKFAPRFRTDDDTGLKSPVTHKDGSDWLELVCEIHGKHFGNRLTSLSGTQYIRLLISLHISKANELAKSRHTLLILETEGSSFDEGNFEKLIRQFSDIPYQVIVAVPRSVESNVTEIRDGRLSVCNGFDYLHGWSIQAVGGRPVWSLFSEV